MDTNRAVGVIDYGGGNLRSLVKGLESLGVVPHLITDPEQLKEVGILFFPGQGAFGDCMGKLDRLGLTDPLRDWVGTDRPFFGICVGYQLLFESSEETPGCAGLGVLKGTVTRFPPGVLKVPHMGWNAAVLRESGQPPWQDLGPAPYFYYVHSYFPSPADDSIVAAETDYGLRFAAAVQRSRLLATQFHPEKSQKAGMRLIANFLEQHR